MGACEAGRYAANSPRDFQSVSLRESRGPDTTARGLNHSERIAIDGEHSTDAGVWQVPL